MALCHSRRLIRALQSEGILLNLVITFFRPARRGKDILISDHDDLIISSIYPIPVKHRAPTNSPSAKLGARCDGDSGTCQSLTLVITGPHMGSKFAGHQRVHLLFVTVK